MVKKKKKYFFQTFKINFFFFFFPGYREILIAIWNRLIEKYKI
jgi:hypothetical protein